MFDLIGDIGGLVRTVVAFLAVLSVIVVIHELGHYWMARLFKVKIDSFSVGFGGEIAGWTDRLKTRWRVAWIPLGGYVKFHGDENPASVPDREHLERMKADPVYKETFHFKPLWQRALIVAAGPAANFILAIVIFAALFMTFGEPQFPPRVDGIVEDSVAERAGFQQGDVILSVDGREIRYFSDLQSYVTLGAGRALSFVVEREGREETIVVTPEIQEFEDQFAIRHKGGRLGVMVQPTEDDIIHKRYNPVTALWRGVTQTGEVVSQTVQFVGGIIAGRLPADQLGGPVRIAQVSGQVASVDLLALVQLVALLSVSIGLINLLPIPILDGGHLLFYGYEAVAGRPLNEKAQEFGFRIGFALVIMVMLFVTWNDLGRLNLFGS